jgi:hypothetical protein
LKHNKRKPCKECPFLKTSVAGWLGPDSAQEVTSRVHGEAEYPCHMDVDVSIKRDGSFIQNGHTCAHPDKVEQCVGAIICANKSFKRYRVPELAAHQDAVKGCPEEKDVMNAWEFKKHHGDKNE